MIFSSDFQSFQQTEGHDIPCYALAVTRRQPYIARSRTGDRTDNAHLADAIPMKVVSTQRKGFPHYRRRIGGPGCSQGKWWPLFTPHVYLLSDLILDENSRASASKSLPGTSVEPFAASLRIEKVKMIAEKRPRCFESSLRFSKRYTL